MTSHSLTDPAELLRFGDFELCLQSYELHHLGQPIPVEPQVLEVLAHLALHAGQVVSKEELWQAVWKGRVVSDAAISLSLIHI